MASLSQLPTEILLKIFQEQPHPNKAYFTLRLVSKRISQIATPLAFESIDLEYDSYMWPYLGGINVCEKMKRLLESGLIDYARCLSISPAVAPVDSKDLNLHGLEEFWERCGGTIKSLKIEARDPPRRNRSSDGSLDARFLWKLQSLLSDAPMANLTTLHVETISPSCLFQLYDPILRTRKPYEDERDKLQYTQPRAYFPSLEDFTARFGGSGSDCFFCYHSIPPAIALFLTGCKKLKSFHVDVTDPLIYTHGDNMTERWGSPIILTRSDGFDPSNMTTLSLYLHATFDDTSKVVNLLSKMPKLRDVSLGYIAVKRKDGSPDWSHVFNVMRDLEELRVYRFEELQSERHPFDEGDRAEDYINKYMGGVCSAAEYTALLDWFEDCALREDLNSESRTEHEALDRLKEVVSERRGERGLGKKWDDGRGSRFECRSQEGEELLPTESNDGGTVIGGSRNDPEEADDEEDDPSAGGGHS